MPIWVAVIYAAFGLLMAALMLRSYWVTRYSNFMSLPIVEALQNAIRLRRRQNMVTTIGIAGGCIVIATFYIYLEVGIIGFFIGLALGLIIGIKKQLTQRELIREIEDSLRDPD